MKFPLILAALCLSGVVLAADKPGVQHMEWPVDGVAREAWVYVPANAKTADTPVIFAFHGHGGTAKAAAARYDFQKYWPEALVVYMQGLPTATMLDPAGAKPGWQSKSDVQPNRDVNFFDVAFAALKKDYKIDSKRVYCTGHSNGAVFTYLMWSARGAAFAAVAPIAGVALNRFQNCKPLPAIHIAGEKDATVPFDMQKQTMEAGRKVNACDEDGKSWGTAGTLTATLYPSKTDAPFVWAVHPGGHPYPDGASELIVKFFKEQAKK
jgi:polyhydroxybutyrate depolymerase